MESSDSNVDEDEKIEFTYNKFDNNNNGGNNDDNQEPDEGNNNKIPSKKLINNKNRKKSVKNIKYKSNYDDSNKINNTTISLVKKYVKQKVCEKLAAYKQKYTFNNNNLIFYRRVLNDEDIYEIY